MKRILYTLAVAALLLQTAGCSDMLEEESRTDIAKKGYMRTAAESEYVLLGAYRSTVATGAYAYCLSCLLNLASDEAKTEGQESTSWREIPTNAHNPSNAQISQTWQALYAMIYNANDFIEHQTAAVGKYDYSDSDRALAEIYVAEARSLRALAYFELVRRFNDVVLMKCTADSGKRNDEFVQADPNDVYAFIEEDLLAAASVLPWADADNMRSDNSFRFSRGAALGLLAKVYATWAGYPLWRTEKWSDAATAARAVVESGHHSLLPDFSMLWENTCNGVWDPRESLIEISFYAPTITGTSSEDPVGRIGKWNGVKALMLEGVRGANAGNWRVTISFNDKWSKQTGDKRYAISVADYKYGNNSTSNPDLDVPGKIKYFDLITKSKPTESDYMKQREFFTPAKWDTELYVQPHNYLINNDYSNINWYVLRYADVLLLYAEALVESGGSAAEALEAVNIVRRRGYGDSEHDLKGLSGDALRQAIRDERAYELAFEGHRKQDLIRWGIYYETIVETGNEIVNLYESGTYAVRRHTVKERHEMLPIPQRELDLMENLHQNRWWAEK